MLENVRIRRELAKQTILLFFVFALVFSLLGVGVYRMVSDSIFRTADEQLAMVNPNGIAAINVAPAVNIDSSASASVQLDANTEYQAEIGSAAATTLDAVSANPQLVVLMRDAAGNAINTVGLYTAYPTYLDNIAFDPNDRDRIYPASADNHQYRGITYAVDSATAPYLQVLINVDSELAILDQFTRILIAYLVIAVLVSAAASYLLSRRTLKPLVANWRTQTEFVQNASHELRTPLSVIQTTSELLLDHPQSSIIDRFEDVNTISEESKRLSRLVNELMELSVGDGGHAELHLTNMDVDGMIADVASAYGDFIETQGKQLRVEASYEGTIEADKDKIRQLMGIVLDNAIKYTSAGDSIVLATKAKGSKCVITISDTGCGIAADDRVHAFERFYRADKARSRETGGHGLGLSLAQGIVQAHGGSIALDSNVPRGTVVIITLPR